MHILIPIMYVKQRMKIMEYLNPNTELHSVINAHTHL